MPVISMEFNFFKPAFYDELLTIKTILRDIPKARMKFEYEFYNDSGIMITSAEVALAFIKNNTRKPCFPPSFLMESLKRYLSINETKR